MQVESELGSESRCHTLVTRLWSDSGQTLNTIYSYLEFGFYELSRD